MITLTLRVVAIREEARDTKTLSLERADHQPLVYQAGQFLTGLFSFHGRELRRSYSFSSTPGIDPLPAITVKRVPNGEISRYMLDHVHPGDSLLTLPPAGRFTLDPADNPSPLFFIAAGSGLVPIFSLIKQALTTQPQRAITLISQQHDPASTPFHKDLQTLADRIHYIPYYSTTTGRLNNWSLEERILELQPPATTRFYLCGPVPFMRMAQFTLRTVGYPEEAIKKEHFTIEHLPAPPPALDTQPKTVTIHSAKGDWQFQTVWPDTVLTAALKHNIPLPYSCRAGRCSTCITRLQKGRVRMSNNEVLTEKDLRQGLVLTCTGYAETDLELSFE